MPLLHRKPFSRTPLPADLDPTERLFFCRVTNEVFRDYDEFFERTILCNSLVWSCSFTGKSGLTFQEALESEKKVKKSLQNFPESLAVPVLYLSTLASHQKLSDLCDNVYEYVKDRFFVGETVTVVRNSGARLECTVLEIKAPPQQNGMVNGNNTNVDNDTIVISDSDDDEPTVPDSWKKIEPIDPTLFKYKVKPVVEAMYESVTVRQCQVSRKSSIFSKDRLKFFLKLHCEIQNGFVKAKANTISKYQILEKNYFRYFPDEPPRFEPSTDKKPVPRENGLTPRQSLLAAAKERERIEQHRRELRAMDLERERLRRVRADRIKSRARERDQINQKEEFKKIAEVERLKKIEERESIKLERDKEREKIREEKRKYAERLKMWNKRREDMECEDLEELPAATPVKTRLPPECFGDALMVSEFLHAFGDLFDLKDEFPEGMSFDMLEDALVGSDPEGPLCELLFFFLSAIFQAMCEEEEEAAKDHITEAEARRLKEALGEGTDSTNYALFAVASLAAAWPQLNHGCSLKELNLDSCTLSEILRLHILSSGADSNSASAKYRYQKQGGFVATDDACMELRLNHPAILKKLTTTSVYSLSPDEKLKILHALCGKLLTLVSTREYIEDSVEELRQAKQEFRELKAGQNRKEREEAAARIRKRKEERLKEQELKIKDKEDQLREDNVPKAAGNEEQENLQAGNENKDAEQKEKEKEQDAAAEDEEMPPPSKKRRGMRSHNGSKENRNQETEPVDEEKQKHEREQELIDKIQQVTACTNITPLGRDRWYRRFWTFFSIPGLFVEEDYSGITEDMLQPRPASHREPETKPIVNGHDDSVEEIKEESEASKPVNKANRWCYYSSVEQLEQLIGSLNTRGYRESTLKEALVQEKSKICQKLSNFPAERFNVSENPPSSEETKPGRGRSLNALGSTPISGEKQLELRLCELLLDIEDRIYQGSLGTVKVPDRQLWRAALENCSYELLDDDQKDKSLKVEDNDVEEMEVDGSQSIKDGLQGVKNEEPSVPSTNASTPQPVATSLQYLARALVQIEQGVERKYLKAPLGDADDTKNSKSDKKKKEDRKKKEDDQTSEKDDTNESGRIPRTVLDRWRESLQSSGNFSQIFLHLSTLDRSILWSRSILNFRCKVCRKKGDSESMILCEGCERVHHIYCVRPKLKFIPDGDWFCGVCRPRRRGRKPGPRPRPPVDNDVEEEDLAEEEALPRDFEKEEEEETIVCEEESTKKKNKAKVQLPLKIKGGKSPGKPGPKKKPGKSPKSQQGTPKNTPPASKGRGRKANSAPPQEKKGAARHSVHTPQPSAEAHETSLVELVSTPGIGRGRGRGKKIKSVDNTPEFSPFAFRPFTLENLKQIPIGQEEQFENFTPTRKGRGRGKKRLTEISTSDQGNRRSSGRHQGVHELSACEQLVVDLVRHDDSWPFMRLVSKAQVPDYFDVIQKPIALNIIREKVNKCEYSSATEFIEDVQLMFSNCFEYNQPASNEANAGLRLQSFFVDEAQKLGLEVPIISKPIIPPEPTKKSHI